MEIEKKAWNIYIYLSLIIIISSYVCRKYFYYFPQPLYIALSFIALGFMFLGIWKNVKDNKLQKQKAEAFKNKMKDDLSKQELQQRKKKRYK